MKSLYTRVMSQRLRPLAVSLLFLLVSVGTYQLGTTYLRSDQTHAESPAGTWQQYVIADGQPVYLATFNFYPKGSDFDVSPVDVAPCTFPQSGFRTFDHRYEGDRWSFRSDWHEYGVAQFELSRVDNNRFEGYAYLDGQPRPYRHILLRVGD
jgi:hypothetical protein